MSWAVSFQPILRSLVRKLILATQAYVRLVSFSVVRQITILSLKGHWEKVNVFTKYVHQLVDDYSEANTSTSQRDRLNLAGHANAAGATVTRNEVDVSILRGLGNKPKTLNCSNYYGTIMPDVIHRNFKEKLTQLILVMHCRDKCQQTLVLVTNDWAYLCVQWLEANQRFILQKN